MNWLDIIIIAVLVISVFIGLRVGIIKAVLSLVGVIVGVLLAGKFYVLLAERLVFIPQEALARIAAFAIILIGVMLIAGILAAVLGWAVSLVMLGWLNRLGGAIFGLVMGALFCGALLAIWGRFIGEPGAVAQSAIAAVLLDNFPMVLALLPDEFDAVRSFFP